MQCALLSNTNVIHWHRDDIGPLLQARFDKLFLSFETGQLKPDASAFTDVIVTLGRSAERILFLDDNPLNIVAARDCGMQARLTNGESGLHAHLRQAGLI